MGMISEWRERRRRKRALTKAAQVLDSALSGKDVAELEREGGWDILATLQGWCKVEDVWKTFTKAEMERLMCTSAVIYACVAKICFSAPDAFLEVGMWDGDSWEPDDKHPALDLLRQPNPTMDWRTYLWSFLSHWLLTGESYVWKLRNKGGDIVGLYPVPTSWVRRETSNDGKLSFYEIGTIGQGGTRIPPEDMFVAYFPSPGNPNVGTGPTQAALKDLQIDDARAAMMIEILSNTHFAGTVLHQLDPWTTEQKDEMRSVLRDVIGPGKRANPLFVFGEQAKVEFPQPPSDIDWPGTAGLSEARICSCYGVPPVLVGMRVGLEHSTYSNYETAKKSFYRDTMRPLWDWVASTHERGLFRDEGEEDEVEADYDHIPEMQEDVTERHDRVLKDFHGGLLTMDAALELDGYETMGGEAGKTRLIPMSLVEFEPGAAVAVPPREPHAGEGEPEPEPKPPAETEPEAEEEEPEEE